MANATPTETCVRGGSCGDLDDVEFSNTDDSLVIMSLLEDSQVEDGDDERLRAVIQSLEAEIMCQNSCLEAYDSKACPGHYRFCDVEQPDSCSTSPDHCLDFEWIDMETVQTDYSIRDDEMTNYFVELGGVGDYSQVYSYGMAMDHEDDYSDLWR
ncbi:hypothetical protein Salat_0233300 [Sesamum alatum]|uniref:Uncharacterized protein n=1 Tax=Sesamum alatum TaxID=300844 RepID=A0AAE1YZ84_9LAMI|nr:hypothetical protein Salat_0233300 [Sesamum alatum]